MMRTDLCWLQKRWPGRLAIMPRPRGGDWLEDEVRSWRQSGIDVVVSLLTPEEVEDLELTQEAALCRANGIEFVTLPIVDRSVPTSKRAVLELASTLAEQLRAGKNIAIHCRQGIGRAALIALSVLAVMGIAPDAAISMVGAARGCAVPETAEQRQWIADFARGLRAPVSQA